MSEIIVPIQFVQGVLRAASSNGIAVDSMLTRDIIGAETTRGVSLPKVAQIILELTVKSPFTTILPMMRVVNDEAISEMIAISSSSKTLHEAMQNLLQVGPFSALGLSLLYQTDDNVDRLCVSADATLGDARQLFLEMMTAAFVRFLPHQFARQGIILKVEFEYSLQGNPREYESFFGCPVLFEQPETCIYLATGAMEHTIESFSPSLLSEAKMLLREKTDNFLALQGIRYRTIQVVRSLVQDQIRAATAGGRSPDKLDLSVNAIANRLDISGRSLQRRLNAEATTFIACKNQAVLEEAKSLIRSGNSNFDLMAGWLGFSDRASFSKVFKKYEGVWPAQYSMNS